MMKQLFLTLTVVLVAMTLAMGQSKGPEIKFDNPEHDYGNFREQDGKVNHVFWFTNTGDEDLVLTRVQPGCGCTASDYTKTPVAPGQRGMVTAAYDPTNRPGPFRKNIMVVSNAKTNGTMNIFIKGNVVGKPKDHTDTFRVHLGDLLFERNNPVFHNMRFDEIRNDTVRFYNNSDKEMQVNVKETPSHIKATLSGTRFKPGHRGYIALQYNAGMLTQQGNRNDRIILQTSDAKQEQKMLFITANIMERPPAPTPAQLYPFAMGNLLMSRNGVSFAQILNTETQTDSVTIYNNGERPIKVDFQKPAAHLVANLSSNVIKPGATATVTIKYDAVRVNAFGFQSGDRLYLQTDDSIQPLKIIYVSANIKEDFSKLTPKQRENAPKIEVDEKIFDFGTRPSGNDIPHSFTFRNTGKSDLIIRKVHASCGCTATTPEKTTIKPGESSKIDINFNTAGRKGNQFKSITVITNDPNNPEVMLQVKGNLE